MRLEVRVIGGQATVALVGLTNEKDRQCDGDEVRIRPTSPAEPRAQKMERVGEYSLVQSISPMEATPDNLCLTHRIALCPGLIVRPCRLIGELIKSL